MPKRENQSVSALPPPLERAIVPVLGPFHRGLKLGRHLHLAVRNALALLSQLCQLPVDLSQFGLGLALTALERCFRVVEIAATWTRRRRSDDRVGCRACA